MRVNVTNRGTKKKLIVAIWASVFNSSSEKKQDGNFEYYDKWLNEGNEPSNEALWSLYLVHVSDWDFIFTDDISEWLSRYSMHLQGVYSYSQNYDELPVLWVEVLKIINAETKEAQQAWVRINGKKTT